MSTPGGDGINVPLMRVQLIVGDEASFDAMKRQYHHIIIYLAADKKLLAKVDVRSVSSHPFSSSLCSSIASTGSVKSCGEK